MFDLTTGPKDRIALAAGRSVAQVPRPVVTGVGRPVARTRRGARGTTTTLADDNVRRRRVSSTARGVDGACCRAGQRDMYFFFIRFPKVRSETYAYKKRTLVRRVTYVSVR